MRFFFTVFLTVFIAEIADKTQLATMLYASDAQHSRLLVFIGSAAALSLSSALAVFAGTMLSGWIDARVLGKIAGVSFVLIGLWTFLRAW